MKIAIPEGMIKAAQVALHEYWKRSSEDRDGTVPMVIEAVLLWLSENPIVPTDEQVAEMRKELVPVHPHWANIVAVWQRRMFLAPEPEVPIELADLLVGVHPDVAPIAIEAYRRGQRNSR